MKICVVSLNIVPFFQSDKRSQFGGAEVQAAFVANALSHAGHDVSLVVSDLGDGDALPYTAYNAYNSSDGVPGFRFISPRTPGILRALREADADVYYQRNSGMVTGVTGMFCRRHNRTFVFGGGSPIDYSIRKAEIRSLRDKLIFYYGLRAADGVIVQNEEQRIEAAHAVSVPIRTIPNGVITTDAGAHEERDSVVWIGAVRSLKRPDWFVELARRMPQQKFVLIGGAVGSDPEYAKRVFAECEQLENIEATGRIANQQVQEYLQRAKVLVNTSEFEGFPNVYLEAWKYGVPVVSVNDVDGMIAGGELGAIVASLDDMDMALRSLLEDNERLRAMGQRGRQLVEDRFSAAALAPQYDSFFSELLERRSAVVAG